MLKKYELNINEHEKIREYCKKKKLIYICTPWDVKSLKVLETFDVDAYKVASADLTNLPLIELIVKTKKPIILSTGMSTKEEIIKTLDYLKEKKLNL